MKNSIFDFLRSALIPELRSDVTACSARNVHLRLVAVMAMRAFPKKLSVLFHDSDFPVVAANLTVIALGIQFGVHDIIVNVAHDREYGGKIVLHIGYFYVGNRASRRQLLEFAFEFELRKCVDFFGNVYVVDVRNIAFIGNVGNDPETAL